MVTFALISEGVTDQIVIEHIVTHACSDFFDDSIDINPLQPRRDATDQRSAPHAGWELVFEYCEHSILDALSTNDYIIIHLDTDCGDHQKFGLNLTSGGVERPYTELVDDAEKIVISKIGSGLFQKYKDRFLFAISVHSIESWLILCLFGKNEPKNSLDKLNRHLCRKNIKPIIKEYHHYRRVSKLISRKNIKSLLNKDHSLGVFLGKVDRKFRCVVNA